MSMWSRIVVVVALLAASVGGVSLAVSDDGGRRALGGGDEAVAATRAQATSSPAMAERPWRNVLVPAAGIVAALLVGFFVPTGLIGRRFRRLDDVGDAWRSLLEGAPPALS